MIRTRILGTGSYAPSRVVTNAELETRVDTSDAWIQKRTGIRERHFAAENESTSDMAAAAAQAALSMCGVQARTLDAIIVATVSADMPMPSCAVLVQAKIGAHKAFAFDLSAACAGSLYALRVADGLIRTGNAMRVLVIGAELLSRLVNWKDRASCILFGDAAGALVLGPSEDGRGLLSTHLKSDGRVADMLSIRGGGTLYPLSQTVLDTDMHKISMRGRDVYKFAVNVLPDVLREALDANGVLPTEVDHVVTHQANLRIVEAVLDKVGIPRERCWVNLDRFGNTSSASLPFSLDEANRAEKLQTGDLIAMMAIGAGMAWGSALMRW